MSYSEKERKPDQGKEQESRGTDHPAGGFSASSIPNSLMANLISDTGGDSSGSGSVIYRQFMPHRQIPAAEDEADRLSVGIHGSGPDAVKREMGSRLHADLSGVRFHSDIFSESKASQMGARAWTSGRDVYFGKGGFEPHVAAHELVHTVQQGSARGSVSQTVAPGTVQMWSWWPFGKKASRYDEEQDSADIADSLFRIQAGFTASEEREKAERDAEYAKTYDRELNRITRANRGLIREGNGEEQDQAEARRLAQTRANNLRTKKKDYVSKDDKRKFDSKIFSITRETYKELLDRRFQAAKELNEFVYQFNLSNSTSVDETRYRAAKGTYGRNYKLYRQLIQKVELAHADDEIFQSWKQELQETDKKKNRILADAEDIFNEGTAADNSYVKTAAGIRERAGIDQSSKEAYKQIYSKKKTRLDRMAAIYRRRKEASRINVENPDRIDNDSDRESVRSNLISDDMAGSDGSEFFLEGLPEEKTADHPDRQKKKTETLISTKSNDKDEDDAGSVSENGMKENDDSIISTGMKEHNDSIISTGMKESEDENSIPNVAVKSAVETFIRTHSDPTGMREQEEGKIPDDEDNQIIRQSGAVTGELVDQFTPADPNIGDVKKKNDKGKFFGNVAKGLDNIDQLGTAIYDQNLLNTHNTNSLYVLPTVGGIASGIGTMTGLAGVITGAADTARNFRNVRAGGRKMDMVNSGLDTLASVGNTVVSGLSTMKHLGGVPLIGETLKNASAAVGTSFVPGLNIATGGISAFTGAYEGIRGQMSISKIDKQIDALKGIKHKDQKKLMQIFKQGRRISKLHRGTGAMKAIGGAITLGTGIALLSGPLAPITAAVLGIAGAGIGIGNFIYNRKVKSNIRKDVTAEEMGFKDWDREIERVRAQFPDEKLSKAEAKEIILKGNGYEAKTRAEAFKKINQSRAKLLMDITKVEGPLKILAEKVISALGVHRKNGRYAAGAEKLLAEKLGG